MQEKLKSMLSEKRYIHSIGVSETAVKMAQKYGADVEKARIAGLLHDCAKNLSYEDSLKKCAELGVELSDVEKANYALIHAPLGVKVAETEFGITDKEILQEFGNEFDLSIKLWTIDDFGGWEKAYQKYFDDDAMFDKIYNY